MDAGNKPVPFKRYRDVTLWRLPVDLPPSALAAADVMQAVAEPSRYGWTAAWWLRCCSFRVG
jgi:hypothetical protein